MPQGSRAVTPSVGRWGALGCAWALQKALSKPYSVSAELLPVFSHRQFVSLPDVFSCFKHEILKEMIFKTHLYSEE